MWITGTRRTAWQGRCGLPVSYTHLVQGFPEYGPERMGAPITAYNRISDGQNRVHSNIYNPDYVVVVDETLLHSVDVTAGLSEEGAIIINSSKEPAELRKHLGGYKGRVCTVDAEKIDVYKRQGQHPGNGIRQGHH